MKKTFTVMAMVMALTLTAFTEAMSGGGWLYGADGESRANIGFQFDGQQQVIGGTYHDRGATGERDGEFDFGHLRLRFTDVRFVREDLSDEGCIWAAVDYESQDRRNRPGHGGLVLVACDNSDDAGKPDTVGMRVFSGPYLGYVHGGDLQGGNVIDQTK